MSLRQRVRSDEGFSLIEAVVASVILALTASLAAGLIVKTLGVSVGNTQRTTAANIAASRMEIVRGLRAVDIVDGRTALPDAMVGGTTYRIIQDAVYVALDSTGTCSAGGAPAYKRVTVTVSWANMGSTKPIRSDTLRALGFGSDGLESSKGSAAVNVQDGDGVGVEGISVRVATESGFSPTATLVTDSTGCAVFTGLTGGSTYTASVNTIGYADVDGYQASSGSSFGAIAGSMVTTTMAYASAGSLSVQLQSPATATVPSTLSLTLNTSKWATTPNRIFPDCSTVATSPTQCVSGTTVRTAARLFPANYRAWAGTCADADTAGSSLVPVEAGITASLTVPLAAVEITSAIAGNTMIYAVHPQETGTSARCGLGEVITLGTMAQGATATFALPYGTWYVQAGNVVTSTVTSQAAVLNPDATVPKVTVTS